MPEKRLQNKVALVIGASSGIGRAAALGFADNGARVILGARRTAECNKTAEVIRERGGEALTVYVDVTCAGQIRAAIDFALTEWGSLDCAFNNAGMEGDAFTPTAKYPECEWDSVIAVNLTGIFLCMKYELRHMQRSGTGAIVNMSSVAGLVGGTLGCAYHASKHGVLGLTKAAAIEYAARGIRVNAVCPSIIQTPMAARIFTGLEERIIREQPFRRYGLPEEVARAVVWLCTDEASYISGVAFPVDGGFSAR